jgi:hypothetical protein
VNAGAYVTLGAGLVQARRRARIDPTTLDEAFHELELVLKKRFPDLPEGYTLREGLSRARSTEPGLRWDDIDVALGAYEAHRYGDIAASQAPRPELKRLITELGGWR